MREDVTLAAYLAPLEPTLPLATTAKATPTANGSGEQRQVVLLQRRITSSVDEDVDGGDGNGQRRLHMEVVGVPRLIWFRSVWSCARIRVLLLQNILAAQLIDPQAVHAKLLRLSQEDQDVGSSSGGSVVASDEEKVALMKQLKLLEEAATLIIGAPTSGGASKVKGQMALCGHLPVRLVSKDGEVRLLD